MSRTPSYERINYTLRPAKSIERRMIVEASGRLKGFRKVENYRYIGFGSPYFSDFSLIHRSLGITDMLCIEREEGDKERFEFNIPFGCVELKFGKSTDILPQLEWQDRPTIIWLDYDGKLNEEILSDIATVCSDVSPGSLLLLSIRATATDFGEDEESRQQKLKEAVGDRVPVGAKLKAFSSENFPSLLWEIIDTEIRRWISERSSAMSPETRFLYKQIFHFNYQDGTKMLTVGGLIHQVGQEVIHAQCDFGSLFFVRDGKEPYSIRVPKLTLKEMQKLNKFLPGTGREMPYLPEKDVKAYLALYRYFPTFVEVDL